MAPIDIKPWHKHEEKTRPSGLNALRLVEAVLGTLESGGHDDPGGATGTVSRMRPRLNWPFRGVTGTLA